VARHRRRQLKDRCAARRDSRPHWKEPLGFRTRNSSNSVASQRVIRPSRTAPGGIVPPREAVTRSPLARPNLPHETPLLMRDPGGTSPRFGRRSINQRDRRDSPAPGRPDFGTPQRMPACGCELEALVLPVGELEQEQQCVRVHHERMFARARGRALAELGRPSCGSRRPMCDSAIRCSASRGSRFAVVPGSPGSRRAAPPFPSSAAATPSGEARSTSHPAGTGARVQSEKEKELPWHVSCDS
jgi:hypothetical protein